MNVRQYSRDSLVAVDPAEQILPGILVRLRGRDGCSDGGEVGLVVSVDERGNVDVPWSIEPIMEHIVDRMAKEIQEEIDAGIIRDMMSWVKMQK